MTLTKLTGKCFQSPLWGWLVGFLILASCEKEVYSESGGTDSDQAIRFEIGFVSSSGPQVKTVTDKDFITTWQTGDEIGVFAVKQGETLSSNNTIHNIKLTYDGSSWSGNMYWPNDGNPLDFYAYYPYDSSLTDPGNYSHSVKTDQRENPDYAASDLLLAKIKDVVKSDNPVQLMFRHALSLVQVEVVSELSKEQLSGDLTVTLTNVKPVVQLDWDSPVLEGKGTTADITMCKVAGMDYTYRALIPAQELGTETRVTFKQNTTGKEIDMEYSGLQGTDMKAGKVHKYKITLDWDIDPDHEYEIGDVYPYVGPALGIVYWLQSPVSNKSKHGKIVSLDETTGAWADHFADHGATDSDNGRKNMHDIANYINNNVDKSWSNFPAFEWVHTKNAAAEDYSDENSTACWYLPGNDELRILQDACTDFGTANFNHKLSDAGGVTFPFGESFINYWSSTSFTNANAYVWIMSNGTMSPYYGKTVPTSRARCVRAF